MLCFPNCKLNIGLYITRRRDDGYHDLETVFYPVPVQDVLEVVPAGETKSDENPGKRYDQLLNISDIANRLATRH